MEVLLLWQAGKTGKCKILWNRETAVTVCDDVVDFKINVVLFLSYPAILAPRVCSAPDKPPQFRIHAFSLR